MCSENPQGIFAGKMKLIDIIKTSIGLAFIIIFFSGLFGYYFRDLTVAGGLGGIVIGILVSPPLLLIYNIFKKCLNLKGRKDSYVFHTIVAIGVIAVFIFAHDMRRPSSATLFKRVVQNPIPASVNNLQTFTYYSQNSDCFHLLKFNINDTDLKKIIALNNFESVSSDKVPGFNLGSINSTIRVKGISWWDFNSLKSFSTYIAHPDIDDDYFMWVDTINRTVYYMEFKY